MTRAGTGEAQLPPLRAVLDAATIALELVIVAVLYFGLAEAFEGVSLFHLLDLLDTAAAYNQAMWFYGTDSAAAKQMLDCALMYGYLFQVKLAGWRVFCAGRSSLTSRRSVGLRLRRRSICGIWRCAEFI